MQAVDIGIGCQDDLVVAEIGDGVFNVQRPHQGVHLLVLINQRLLLPQDIHRLALERKDRLGHGITRRDDGARRRLTFGDKDHIPPPVG